MASMLGPFGYYVRPSKARYAEQDANHYMQTSYAPQHNFSLPQNCDVIPPTHGYESFSAPRRLEKSNAQYGAPKVNTNAPIEPKPMGKGVTHINISAHIAGPKGQRVTTSCH
jgi:hypothetical protein